MNPNKALWEKGDFTAIAAFMRESGETVVESLGVRPTLQALDLGCGDGTTRFHWPGWELKSLESISPEISLRPGTNGRRNRA
jgi:hypothetical protein